MATTTAQPYNPSPPNAPRPKGILKNSYRGSPPPVSPPAIENPLEAKELTIANTQYNAGHRRSSSAAGSRPAGSRRGSSRTPSSHGDFGGLEDDIEGGQRLKWDEANLYLTEQERSSTMKITEPKTPYAKHYDPTEDLSDLDDNGAGGEEDVDEPIDPNNIDMDRVDGLKSKPTRSPGRHGASSMEDIPGLSLGEPEEEVPEGEFEKRPRAVHVNSTASEGHDSDELLAGLSPEELEKHRMFEERRKKHYEMKNVAALLGHPEVLDEAEEEDGGDDEPSIPPLPARANGI